jgi:hypothetical protein
VEPLAPAVKVAEPRYSSSSGRGHSSHGKWVLGTLADSECISTKFRKTLYVALILFLIQNSTVELDFELT